MIYVDSSVLLADLFAEARHPPETLWDKESAEEFKGEPIIAHASNMVAACRSITRASTGARDRGKFSIVGAQLL